MAVRAAAQWGAPVERKDRRTDGFAQTASTVLLLAAMAVAAPAPAVAQTPRDTLTQAAGPQYEDAGPLRRLFYGRNWRDLWGAPLEAPVLDLGTFSGGLSVLRPGGGRQSITLHLTDAQGDRWIFRSIDKHPSRAGLPWEVESAPAARMIEDHVSALHPGGHFAAPPVLEAVGVLHTPPQLFIMPDDPRLGEHRVVYAGMLGAIERRPNQGPDGSPGFAGSRRVNGWDNFEETLRSGHEHRLDEAELLRARLVDMLLGDPDRGTDQWRWARFGEAGGYMWRPIPEDRDWIFAHADGLFARVAQGVYPKLVRFGAAYAPVERYTFSSHIIDRQLLTRLTREDFEREAEAVRRTVTDDVIDRALAVMPAPYHALSGDRIRAALRSRRDALPRIAAEFYAWLADAVDVRGTLEPERFDIERMDDGAVRVRVQRRTDVPLVAAAGNGSDTTSGSDAARGPITGLAPSHEVYYERLFLPGETREVRVYVHGGDNHVRVTGAADGEITIRVIGGDGADTFEDRAGNVRFYKQDGELELVESSGTRLDRTRWLPPPPPEGLRAGYAWAPDWGVSTGFAPAADYDERSGLLVGVGATRTEYGFRRLPYATELSARAFWAPATGGLRGELAIDRRIENSRRSLRLDVVGKRMDRFPLYGLVTDDARARVAFDYDVFRVAPSMVWWLGARPGLDPEANIVGSDVLEEEERDEDEAVERAEPGVRFSGELRAGPVFSWARLDAPAASLAGLAAADYGGAVSQLGAQASLRLRRHDDRAAPRRGYRMSAAAGVFPIVDGAGAFGDVSAVAAAYVPLLGDGPHMALRAGGERVFGEFPIFEAAFLGGRHSLRGSRTHEYAGDTHVFGNAELRVPVDTVQLFINAELGIFGLADAGRVWRDGASPDGWRTGFGGGAWLAAFGRAVSIAVVRGDRATRLHTWFGLPF
jgi:hypothetical protein